MKKGKGERGGLTRQRRPMKGGGWAKRCYTPPKKATRQSQFRDSQPSQSLFRSANHLPTVTFMVIYPIWNGENGIKLPNYKIKMGPRRNGLTTIHQQTDSKQTMLWIGWQVRKGRIAEGEQPSVLRPRRSSWPVFLLFFTEMIHNTEKSTFTSERRQHRVIRLQYSTWLPFSITTPPGGTGLSLSLSLVSKRKILICKVSGKSQGAS